jgi:hypothetical protein
MLARLAFGLATGFAVLCLAFFAFGGWQLIRLQRGPTLAASATSDAEYFHFAVLENERSGSPEKRSAFDAFSRNLVARAAALDPEALSMEVARGLAIFENAHTHVTDSHLARIPMRFHWFADGLHIVKARPDFASILGARVIALDGHDPEELLHLLGCCIPGVPAWKRYRSEYFLSTPGALKAIGVSAHPSALRMTLRRNDGSSEELSVEADREIPASDSFREFRHVLPWDTSFGTEGWLRVADGIEPKPLYLRDLPRAVPGTRSSTSVSPGAAVTSSRASSQRASSASSRRRVVFSSSPVPTRSPRA